MLDATGKVANRVKNFPLRVRALQGRIDGPSRASSTSFRIGRNGCSARIRVSRRI
jgi:hypothetical protein